MGSPEIPKLMRLRLVRCLCGGLLLLSTIVPCVAQSPSPSTPEKQTITASIDDADLGQPLSNAPLEVQLFPREYGGRKSPSLLCVPGENAQPLFTFSITTDSNGSFSLTVPGGGYLAKITIPQRQPVFDCIFFDSGASVRACGADPSSLRIHQHLFIRIAKSIPGFSGDILGNSACAPLQPSPCDPLRVPNLVHTKNIVVLDSEGSPIRGARLEFHEYTKGKGRFVASLTTDGNGVVDVSSLETGGLLRMSIESERASGEFLIQFTEGGTPGQQSIKLFHWRCKGNLIQGAVAQP